MLDAAALQHHKNRSKDLHKEFQQRVQGYDVVQHAQNHDNDRAQQDSPNLRVNFGKNQHARQKGDKNRKPAHPGNRCVVHPSVVRRDIDCSHLLRELFDQRRNGKGQHCRSQQCKPYLQNEVQIQNHQCFLFAPSAQDKAHLFVDLSERFFRDISGLLRTGFIDRL